MPSSGVSACALICAIEACEKYGSEWAWTLSLPHTPAYAMIDEPLPGSTRTARVSARLSAQTRLLNVCSPPNWWPTSWAT